MKKILFLLLLPLFAISQNTIGLPDIINYSKLSYNAGLQNWDVKQDKNGIVYFANNEGLLSFDGKNWKLYPLPNKTIVRSVSIGSDHKIYVGGQDELGYFAPNANGNLVYYSLTALIPAKHRSFEDVWDIVSSGSALFFRSPNKIFQYFGGAITVFKAPSEWAYLTSCNGKLYAHDYQTGLMAFENDNWQPVVTNYSFSKTDPITGMIPSGSGAIITTLKSGIFYFNNNIITPIKSGAANFLQNERIYSAIAINKEWTALATSNSGVYIINNRAEIIQKFSSTEGLQSNNILSIFLDNKQNLWLGLNNGLDFIAYNSAIKHISPKLLDESGYTAMIQNQQLYIGTSNGLYTVALQPLHDLSFSKGDFALVQNTSGQTWGLSLINNKLLLGHHEGAFYVNNNTATSFSSKPGFWNFTPLGNMSPASIVVGGTYRGLTIFDAKANELFQSLDIPNFIESSRYVTIDGEENIWVSHPYHGVYKIEKNSDGQYTTKQYQKKEGLPALLNNHIYKIKNRIVVGTENGVYEYNSEKDRFEVASSYTSLIGNQSIRYLKEDKEGNIWFIHEKVLGVIDYTGNQPQVIYIPELNGKMLSGFEYIYAIDGSNIFLGGEKGFYHINYEKYKKLAPALNVQIRSVHIIDNLDSTLFGGYFKNVNENQLQEPNRIPQVAYRFKTMHFDFTSVAFGFQNNLEYSYRLKGFENNWSGWTKRTEKEYTNLVPGSYTFEVKVRNNLGNESAVSSYQFKINAPWYRTLFAYLLYFIAIGFGVYKLHIYQRKKFKAQQQKYEQEQQRLRYIHELEINKSETDIVTLQNEKLEVEIEYKNSELASSAMHIVKKGELLTKVKSELGSIIKKIDNEYAITELKKMVKALNEDENLDQEWEYFTKHFDKVHSDFIVKLKEKHSNISNNELKLCAYLRMNLSTKEIAQLMNISVRGVEISRYRLRKKLNLATDTNLFDYLITIG
ncbi:MAG: hypothetical protein RL099_221 [Bacteroidota bacterium]